MNNNNLKRAEFIKEMYSVYWANITRSMEGVWKVLAPLTVVGTIIAGVHQEYLSALFGISLAVLIIFWALNVMIDLNDWHRRNLFFLTKAEQEFLKSEDYGNLLPSKYRIPKNEWITFYKINSLVFLILLAFTTFYSWYHLDCIDFGILILLITIGSIITFLNYRHQNKRSTEKFNELFNKKP